MSKVVTKDFKVHEIQQIIESVDESANTLYFICALKDTPYADDANTPSFYETTQSIRDAYREILFGKKVVPADVAAIARRVDWIANTQYAQFDDTDQQLPEKNFFVVSPESSAYHVFKCIDNNSNAYSTAQPLVSQTSPEDDIYQTSDGYVWKYMYTISQTQLDKFGSNEYIPVFVNANVVANAVSGTIDSYVIEEKGRALNNYCNGYFTISEVDNNPLIYRIESTAFTLSANNNFYANTSIYIDSGRGFGQLRTIDSYTVNGSNTDIQINKAFDPVPDSTSTFRIFPRVLIVGDGKDANAIITMNTSANTISSISIINRGSGYSYANVQILANTGANPITPVVRPVIAPYEGHGSLPENELFASKFSFSVQFSNTEANSISTDISFRRVGLLKDPLFEKVTLTLNTAATFLIGEKVTQSDTTANGIVVSTSNNIITLSNVYGFFSDGNSAIVGESSLNTNFATDIAIQNFSNNVLENRDKYTVELTYSGSSGNGFQVGEEVTQTSTGASGFVSEVSLDSGSIYTVYLTEVKGTFALSDTFEGSTSQAIGTITAHVGPCLEKFSGEFLYIENLDPIQRTPTQTEKINIILGF